MSERTTYTPDRFTIVGHGKWKRLYGRDCRTAEPLPIGCDLATLLKLRREHECKGDE